MFGKNMGNFQCSVRACQHWGDWKCGNGKCETVEKLHWKTRNIYVAGVQHDVNTSRKRRRRDADMRSTVFEWCFALTSIRSVVADPLNFTVLSYSYGFWTSPKWQIVDQWKRLGLGFGAEIFCRPQSEKTGDSLRPLYKYFLNIGFKSSGDGTNLKVGAPVRLKAPEKFLPVVPLHFFGSKSTISRFGERFRDRQYSLVSFLFAVLLYSRCLPVRLCNL